jgi:hypothetical protein
MLSDTRLKNAFTAKTRMNATDRQRRTKDAVKLLSDTNKGNESSLPLLVHGDENRIKARILPSFKITFGSDQGGKVNTAGVEQAVDLGRGFQHQGRNGFVGQTPRVPKWVVLYENDRSSRDDVAWLASEMGTSMQQFGRQQGAEFGSPDIEL